MFGGINAKQMEKVMKQMGIKQEQIDARRVIIECEDSNIVIDDPSVTKVMMQGKETWQISGEAREESKETFSDADVDMVMGKTGKGEEEVRKVLEENGGDIAGAIMELK